MSADVLVGDVAEILDGFGTLPCGVAFSMHDDGRRQLVSLTLTVGGSQTADAAYAVELHERLAYLVGVASVRAFATRYGIEPERLAAFLPAEPDPKRYPDGVRRPPDRGAPTADDIGSAVREFDALVADAVARQGRCEPASVALDALYSRLRVYYGDV